MALWSGRFNSTPDQAVTDFTESISFDKRLYSYDITGSKAHVKMLASSGIIPEETAKQIIDELAKIEKQIENNDFTFSADLEDIHMHIEKALIESLGDEGARVHTARSRNDQIALDIRLYLRDEIDQIIHRIINFEKILVETAEKNIEVILPGYTHLQHAQPVLFAHHLLAYVEMMSRDIARLKGCRERINIMPLGSGAIAGSTLPIDREKVAELLDFPNITRNSMDAVSDRDFICELISCLAIFSMHISRFSEDIILWCSQEFNFVELDDTFCTGSSLMPQKKNPDIAELSRGKTGRIFGNLISILTICKGLPLTYNRDLQEDKEPLFDSIDTIKMILEVFPPMIATMKLNTDKMREAANDPWLIATDLAEALVKSGIPFRTAHKQVGELIKWCIDNNQKPDQISLEDMQLTMPTANEEFLNLFSPEKSITEREVSGATGYNEVRKQIEFWKKTLEL